MKAVKVILLSIFSLLFLQTCHAKSEQELKPAPAAFSITVDGEPVLYNEIDALSDTLIGRERDEDIDYEMESTLFLPLIENENRLTTELGAVIEIIFEQTPDKVILYSHLLNKQGKSIFSRMIDDYELTIENGIARFEINYHSHASSDIFFLKDGALRGFRIVTETDGVLSEYAFVVFFKGMLVYPPSDSMNWYPFPFSVSVDSKTVTVRRINAALDTLIPNEQNMGQIAEHDYETEKEIFLPLLTNQYNIDKPTVKLGDIIEFEIGYPTVSVVLYDHLLNGDGTSYFYSVVDEHILACENGKASFELNQHTAAYLSGDSAELDEKSTRGFRLVFTDIDGFVEEFAFVLYIESSVLIIEPASDTVKITVDGEPVNFIQINPKKDTNNGRKPGDDVNSIIEAAIFMPLINKMDENVLESPVQIGSVIEITFDQPPDDVYIYDHLLNEKGTSVFNRVITEHHFTQKSKTINLSISAHISLFLFSNTTAYEKPFFRGYRILVETAGVTEEFAFVIYVDGFSSTVYIKEN